ncbi:MAG TPA: hypothetical protein VMB18_02695 [Terriglobales bacterium]|nr:hypothetical protein [Terriglobales bacterium]
MKLVIPHTGEMRAVDRRLVSLAEFLGIVCESLRLEEHVRQPAEYIERAVTDEHSCLVINPQLMREWLGRDVLPSDLVRCLVSHFRYLIIHAVTSDSSACGIVASLSRGKLSSVRPVEDVGRPYEIAVNSNDICGAFSGLSFGRVNPDNDRVFTVTSESVRKLICIGGQPLMAELAGDTAKILFIGSEDVADVNAHSGYAPVDDHFSRFMPHAMALRYVFGEECWHPCESHASIIVDDPLLRPNYGFLNFDTLLRLAKEHKFHTSIAFIPHNYRRNSKEILRQFTENPRYFSICYHGNDHTASEFACHDVDFLNTALAIAEKRMRLQYERTGLGCDKVMVFPQSDFSIEAMQVLKSRNFAGAVSSAWHPLGQPVLPLLSDLCQPAMLQYEGFPLFGRNAARSTRSQDVAFNVFFGKPTMTGEHHDSFENVQYLVEAVQRINAVAPRISWSNLATAFSRSLLQRRALDGPVKIKPYSSTVTITNHSPSGEQFSIEWGKPDRCVPLERVLRDGTPCSGVQADDAGVRAVVELPPGGSETFSLVCRNGHVTAESLGFQWNAKAFLRRRLSEVRDNHLSKHQSVLRLAKRLQRRLLPSAAVVSCI